MAKKTKFTDRQKKNIVKCYVDCQNYSAVARKYGCSEVTVRRIVGKNPDVAKMVEEEKSKNEADIRRHMQKQSAQVCELLDRLLENIADPAKLDKASARDLAVTVGIIIDKYSGIKSDDEKEEGGVIILPEIEEGGEQK